jgi:outer membrane receptor protein involved in Fe transport
MVYGFYSRGYKGGGANPPAIGGQIGELIDSFGAGNPSTFAPEFVDAFEIGAKNTLLGGSMILNLGAFFYDYKDYQVSKIVDRIASNENYDAKVWGMEIESIWEPVMNFRVNANVGYLDTRIGNGEKSIDLMDRTQGNADWMLVKPWIQFPSNCIAPVAFVESILETNQENPLVPAILGSNPVVPIYGVGELSLCANAFAADSQFRPILDLLYGQDAVFDLRDAPNGGAGFDADLSGNELPNSPHWTGNIGAQYTWAFSDTWDVTVRGDYYRQSSSYARVYNTEYDRLKGWGNANLAVTVAKPMEDLAIQLYVKNLLDDDPITDAFLNSDDSGLTTNVFVLDPRLIGLSIRKGF